MFTPLTALCLFNSVIFQELNSKEDRVTSQVTGVHLFQNGQSFDLVVTSQVANSDEVFFNHTISILSTGADKKKEKIAAYPLGGSTENHIGTIRLVELLKPGKYQIVTELLGVSANDYRVLDLSTKGEVTELFRKSLKSPPQFADLEMDGTAEILVVTDLQKMDKEAIPATLRQKRWVYQTWKFNQDTHVYEHWGYLDPSKIVIDR